MKKNAFANISSNHMDLSLHPNFANFTLEDHDQVFDDLQQLGKVGENNSYAFFYLFSFLLKSDV